MTATELLRNQHRALHALFSEFERATEPLMRARIVAAIAEELIAHMAAERTVFRPAIRKYASRSVLRAVQVTHIETRRQLRNVLSVLGDDELLANAVQILANVVLQHAQEEEISLFPVVERAMPEEAQELLAEELSDARPPVWLIASEAHMRNACVGRLRPKVSLGIPAAHS